MKNRNIVQFFFMFFFQKRKIKPENFYENLGKLELSNLAGCQAFNNPKYLWLQQLNSLAGKGKHEHLIEQNRIDYTYYTLEFAPEGKVIWRVSTTKVDPENLAQTRKKYINSEVLPENDGLKETIKQRSSFTISEINQEALLF